MKVCTAWQYGSESIGCRMLAYEKVDRRTDKMSVNEYTFKMVI